MRYVTVTNRGYVAFVLNWLVTVRRSGVSIKDCRVYCTDHEAAQALVPTGADLVPMVDDSFPKQPGFWMDEAFRSMCWAKFVCMRAELQHGKPFVFTDVDLVFHADPGIILDGINGIDLAAQVSCEPAGRFRLCGGFLYLMPTETTRRLLDYTDREQFTNDEDVLNERLIADRSIRWLALPADRFADGSYGGNVPPHKRFITHFNHTKGTRVKWHQMIRSGQWFIDMKPEGCE